MDIIKKLNNMRLERNMSVYRLSELSGINQSTLANTFSRGTIPSIENLEKMCEAMGITMAQFFTEEETQSCLTDDEMQLVRQYRKLTKQMRASVSVLLARIAEESAVR